MRTRAVLGAVVVLTSVFAVAPAAEAATVCPPSPAPGSTVVGNITVPGGVCILQNVTVTGNVTVSPGAELIMEDGHVGGNITATDAWTWVGGVRIEPEVGGSMTINAPRGWEICAINFGGSFSEQGQTASPAPPTAFPPCTTPPGVTTETFGGNATIANNAVPTVLAGTMVHGNLTATGNMGGVLLDHLTIGGTATCSNTPPALFASSTASGKNTCPG